MSNISHFFKKEYRKYHIDTLVLLVLIAYANTFNNDFVYDDMFAFVNNPLIKSWSSVTANPFQFVQPFVYFLISNIFGIIPFWFRLMNILAHIGTVLLLFLTGSILTSPIGGFVAAAIYAVHPLNSEAVSWISAGPYAWYTFLFMLSFWLYIRFEKKNPYYIFSVISFWFALMIGIPAVVLSLVFVLYEYFFGDLKKKWKYIIPYVVLSGIYGILAISGIGARSETFQTALYQNYKYYNPVWQIPTAITTYLELFIFPHRLTVAYSELDFPVWYIGFKIIVLISFFAALIYSFIKKYTVLFFGLSFFLMSLLPTLTPHSFHFIVAERYVYCGVIGLCLIVGHYFEKLQKSKYSQFAWIIFGVIIIVFTIRTIIRNTDWENNENLWTRTVLTSPSDSVTQNNLGDVQAARGDLIGAEKAYLAAIKLQPQYADAYYNIGTLYQQAGQPQVAFQFYNTAVQKNPRLWQAHQNLTALYFAASQWKEADFHIQKAIEVNPNSSMLWMYKGFIAFQQGKKDEARIALLKSVQLDPQNERARMILGETYK